MLFPYAFRFPRRAPCALDRWAGRGWRLVERHTIETTASPGAALSALAALRLRDMPVVRALFALRRLVASPDVTLHQFFSTAPFVLLEQEKGAEFVAGVLLPAPEQDRPRFLRPLPSSPPGFGRALKRAPLAAIVTFRAEPRIHGAVLWTETWVRTRGAAAAAIFAVYWLAIGPFSAWIRRIFLREARSRAEGERAD